MLNEKSKGKIVRDIINHYQIRLMYSNSKQKQKEMQIDNPKSKNDIDNKESIILFEHVSPQKTTSSQNQYHYQQVKIRTCVNLKLIKAPNQLSANSYQHEDQNVSDSHTEFKMHSKQNFGKSRLQPFIMSDRVLNEDIPISNYFKPSPKAIQFISSPIKTPRENSILLPTEQLSRNTLRQQKKIKFQLENNSNLGSYLYSNQDKNMINDQIKYPSQQVLSDKIQPKLLLSSKISKMEQQLELKTILPILSDTKIKIISINQLKERQSPLPISNNVSLKIFGQRKSQFLQFQEKNQSDQLLDQQMNSNQMITNKHLKSYSQQLSSPQPKQFQMIKELKITSQSKNQYDSPADDPNRLNQLDKLSNQVTDRVVESKFIQKPKPAANINSIFSSTRSSLFLSDINPSPRTSVLLTPQTLGNQNKILEKYKAQSKYQNVQLHKLHQEHQKYLIQALKSDKLMQEDEQNSYKLLLLQSFQNETQLPISPQNKKEYSKIAENLSLRFASNQVNMYV